MRADDLDLWNELVRDEGLKYEAYTDSVGLWTIGVGHLLGPTKRMERITDDEARALFYRDVQNAMDVVARIFTFTSCDCGHKVCEADRVRYRVLVNMAFNLGPTRLKGFKKFIAAFDAKDWDGAVIEMLDSKWAKQVGARAIRLAKMVRTGVAE